MSKQARGKKDSEWEKWTYDQMGRCLIGEVHWGGIESADGRVVNEWIVTGGKRKEARVEPKFPTIPMKREGKEEISVLLLLSRHRSVCQ